MIQLQENTGNNGPEFQKIPAKTYEGTIQIVRTHQNGQNWTSLYAHLLKNLHTLYATVRFLRPPSHCSM